MEANPWAALVFHWAVLERQVRVEGSVERITAERSDAYFRTRSRGSRIGAWASRQSQPLAERRELEARCREVGARWPGDDIPLPPFWGGYRLVPEAVEFWQGRADRLHDRWRWTRAAGAWTVERLYP
jgi:pyridoxamine 5'-phosphate oxidase